MSITPEQLDEIKKLAADGAFKAAGYYALPLVKALREARADLFAEKALHKLTQTERDQARAGIHAACGNRHPEGACVLETVRLVQIRTKERDESRAEVERLKESVVNLDALYVSRTDALRESEAEVERLREGMQTAMSYCDACYLMYECASCTHTREVLGKKL